MKILSSSLLKKIMLLCAYSFSVPAIAENNQYLSLGLTQTDNLEIQSGSDISLSNGNVKRTGVETGLSLQKQSLDFSGGYTTEANFNHNKGLNGTGNISSIDLSATKLKAISANWLVRSTISLHHYNNQPLPVNSYKGIQLENTFGYLKDNNSGTDIALKFVNENHNKDADDSYKTQRSGIKISHYFAHIKNVPYWVINAAVTQNNANDEQRDFDSYSAGIEFRQWTLGLFKGTTGLQLQQDNYKQIEGALSNRKDKYALLQVNVSKQIKKNLGLHISASTGRYQSSRLSVDENFYQLTSNLSWQF